MATFSTALVTGASAGIGKALASELAARGTDVVLVARRRDRLDRLATELSDRHGVRTEVISVDLTDDGDLELVERRLAADHRPVDLLVNNAGFATQGEFADLPVGKEVEELRLNVLAVLRLTHAALGPMVRRGHGGVLNVSSLAGDQPLPGNATYAGSKAFVSTFTESIRTEARGHGVHVTLLKPGFTRTDFQDTGDLDVPPLPGFLWLDPAEVAREAVDAVEADRAVCVPGKPYKALVGITGVTPRAIIRAVTSRVRTY